MKLKIPFLNIKKNKNKKKCENNDPLCATILHVYDLI